MPTDPQAPIYPRPTFPLLRFLQADNLLADTPVLGRMEQVRSSLDYPLTDREHPLSPVEALHELQRQSAAIPGIQLQPVLVPGEENSYHVNLTMAYELVLNQAQRVMVSATAFLGHLKASHTRITRIGSIFNLWWVDGAEEVMEAVGRTKQKTTKALEVMATDEFSTAMEEKDIEVGAVIEATTLLIGNLKATLKLAEATYQLGRDQINVILTDCNVPNAGYSGSAPTALKVTQAQSGTMDTLRQAFGRRVQDAPAPAVVVEDDLEAALSRSNLPGLTYGGDSPIKLEVSGDGNLTDYTTALPADMLIAESNEIQAGAQDFVAEQELLNEIKGLVEDAPAPEPVMLPVAAEPVAAVRKQGAPLPVTFNLSLLASGITGKHDGVILRKGNSKLELMAQTDPAENGIYRFMGADQPLVRMEEGTPSKELTQAHADPKPEAPAVPPVQTVTKTDPEDPFAKVSVTAPVVSQELKQAPAEVDDLDAAMAQPVVVTVPAAAVVLDDEDELLSHVTVVIDKTPAKDETPAAPEVVAPVQPTEPAPGVTGTSHAVIPNQLFRSRNFVNPSLPRITTPLPPELIAKMDALRATASGLDDVL